MNKHFMLKIEKNFMLKTCSKFHLILAKRRIYRKISVNNMGL